MYLVRRIKKEGANISIKLYIKEIYNFEHVFINE